MGLRSAWWVAVGPVVLGAVACSGRVANEEADDFFDDGAAGKVGSVAGGAAGKAGSAHGGARSSLAGAPSVGGVADFPGHAGGRLGGGHAGAGGRPGDGYAGGVDDPAAGAGGVAYYPPCAEVGACAGSPGAFAGAGGWDDSTPGTCSSGTGCIVAASGAIRALAADASDLYWVDHGTFDALGNYDNDGRLLKRDLAGISSEVPLANGLAGPVGVGLTTTHVFVYLDQVWQGKPRYALARLPIAGGAAEVVQLDAWPNGETGGDCVGCLVHAGDTLYFPLKTGIYKIAAQDAEPTLFLAVPPSSLAIAGEYLYLVARADGSIWRVPLAGGIAEPISADPRLNIQAAAGYLYSLENSGNKTYLTRMPATGGPWIRLPKARGYFASQLQIAGDWFFHDLVSDAGQQFVAGRLADTASAAVPLTLASWANVQAWVGTAQGIFWSDGRVIRQRFNSE